MREDVDDIIRAATPIVYVVVAGLVAIVISAIDISNDARIAGYTLAATIAGNGGGMANANRQNELKKQSTSRTKPLP